MMMLGIQHVAVFCFGLLSATAGAFVVGGSGESRVTPPRLFAASAAASDHDILLRAARGEATERTPVWLMRQAGRYMADFRKIYDQYGFRTRSETPALATELSLQCWRAFGVDGVIMFSDILTILPALGVEFDIVPGKGPKITDVLRGEARVAKFVEKAAAFDPATQLSFTGETLRNLRAETEGKTTLVGFVGAPWTLAAYAVEGGSAKAALTMKGMMLDTPELAHSMLTALANAVADYACYQIDNGAQVVQLFESWAHQLSPGDFEVFAKPYASAVAAKVKAAHPDVPLIFFANGGSSYLHKQRDLVGPGLYNAISLDWQADLAVARDALGDDCTIQGNVDPAVLLGDQAAIEKAVEKCIHDAGGPGNKHIFNLGHGVMKQTPEDNVKFLIDTVKRVGQRH